MSLVKYSLNAILLIFGIICITCIDIVYGAQEGVDPFVSSLTGIVAGVVIWISLIAIKMSQTIAIFIGFTVPFVILWVYLYKEKERIISSVVACIFAAFYFSVLYRKESVSIIIGASNTPSTKNDNDNRILIIGISALGVVAIVAIMAILGKSMSNNK